MLWFPPRRLWGYRTEGIPQGAEPAQSDFTSQEGGTQTGLAATLAHLPFPFQMTAFKVVITPFSPQGGDSASLGRSALALGRPQLRRSSRDACYLRPRRWDISVEALALSLTTRRVGMSRLHYYRMEAHTHGVTIMYVEVSSGLDMTIAILIFLHSFIH